MASKQARGDVRVPLAPCALERRVRAALGEAQARFAALFERQRGMKEASEAQDAAMVRAQFREADGTYRAWMCRRCGFGPVDHGKCLDLRSHHGERRGGFVTSNACPACGWFVNERDGPRGWWKWDGKEVGVGRPEAEWTPGVVSDAANVPLPAPYIPPDDDEIEQRAAERRRIEQGGDIRSALAQ